MTAEPSVFPQMLFSAPLLFFPFVLVDVSPEIWLPLFHLHTPPSGAECLNKPELVEDTDSKYIASQISSSWMFIVLYSSLNHLTFSRPQHQSLTTFPCGKTSLLLLLQLVVRYSLPVFKLEFESSVSLHWTHLKLFQLVHPMHFLHGDSLHSDNEEQEKKSSLPLPATPQIYPVWPQVKIRNFGFLTWNQRAEADKKNITQCDRLNIMFQTSDFNVYLNIFVETLVWCLYLQLYSLRNLILDPGIG